MTVNLKLIDTLFFAKNSSVNILLAIETGKIKHYLNKRHKIFYLFIQLLIKVSITCFGTIVS